MKDKIQPKVTTCVPQMSYFALNFSKIASFWGLRPQTPVASGPPANIFGIRPYGPPPPPPLQNPGCATDVQHTFHCKNVKCLDESALAKGDPMFRWNSCPICLFEAIICTDTAVAIVKRLIQLIQGRRNVA